MKAALFLLAAVTATPAGASHDWVGLDLCRAYPERMPPPLDPGALPEPEGPGARLLVQRCGQCHHAPAPGHHTAREWAEVLARMQLLMEVTARFGGRARPVEVPGAEDRAVLLAYLERHALRPLADPDAAPPAYRALCQDCHAAPDPAGYPAADWPAVIGRMAGHRVPMGRPPADPDAEGQVRAFLAPAAARDAGLDPGRLTAAGAGPGRESEGPVPEGAAGRWLALGPFFAVALLGAGRWWRRRGREA